MNDPLGDGHQPANEPLPGRAATKVIVLERAPRRRAYIAAAPAAVTIALTALLLLAARGQDVSAAYERAATDAIVAGDYVTAQVCFERLLQRAGGGATQRYRDGLRLANARIGMLRKSALHGRNTGAAQDGR